MEAVDPIVFRLAIFVLAIFVGYYVAVSYTHLDVYKRQNHGKPR